MKDAAVYFLALIVSFMGLLTGILLAFLTKEELESNRKYLVLAKKIFMGLLFGIVGLGYSGSIGIAVLFFLLGFGLFWFVHNPIPIYLLLGSIFFLGWLFEGVFPLVSVLIMVYGFAEGTLVAQDYISLTTPKISKINATKTNMTLADMIKIHLLPEKHKSLARKKKADKKLGKRPCIELAKKVAFAGAAYLIFAAALFLLKQVP